MSLVTLRRTRFSLALPITIDFNALLQRANLTIQLVVGNIADETLATIELSKSQEETG
jgi:hypothetical protein